MGQAHRKLHALRQRKAKPIAAVLLAWLKRHDPLRILARHPRAIAADTRAPSRHDLSAVNQTESVERGNAATHVLGG